MKAVWMKVVWMKAVWKKLNNQVTQTQATAFEIETFRATLLTPCSGLLRQPAELIEQPF